MADNGNDRDDCVSSEQIKRVQEQVLQGGVDPALNDLAERESSLAVYVICSAALIADTARIAGANRRFVEWVEREVLLRTLVCVESQHLAHYELWRDLMGDEPDPIEPTEPNDPKGDGHV
ncbi:MAG TPA: hypothetical protein VIM11_05220 [Tepidisphaeraceae bacterium]|jgi:hypothetical protein